MGFVIVDGRGTICVQRADIYFGRHASHIAEILRRLAAQERWRAPRGNPELAPSRSCAWCRGMRHET